MTNPLRLLSFCAVLIVLVVVLISISGTERSAVNVEPHEAQAPVETTSHLHLGIDVSYHSGAVHWDSVAAQKIGFAFVKATEGNDFKDPAFDAHWESLRQSGLRRGAYHFYVTEDAPETQAELFISNVVLEPGDLAPVVDIEVIGHNTSPGLADRLTVYLALIEKHYGVRPIIYTSPNFWNEHLSADFGHYPLWIAEYGVDEPRLPNGWDVWHLWQWKGDTTIAGVEKTADVSRVNSEQASLADLIIAYENSLSANR